MQISKSLSRLLEKNSKTQENSNNNYKVPWGRIAKAQGASVHGGHGSWGFSGKLSGAREVMERWGKERGGELTEAQSHSPAAEGLGVERILNNSGQLQGLHASAVLQRQGDDEERWNMFSSAM